jgi:hypothetical protein
VDSQYFASAISVHCLTPPGDGVREAFDKWLDAGHTMGEFVQVLVELEKKVLARDLGDAVLAMYEAMQ